MRAVVQGGGQIKHDTKHTHTRAYNGFKWGVEGCDVVEVALLHFSHQALEHLVRGIHSKHGLACKTSDGRRAAKSNAKITRTPQGRATHKRAHTFHTQTHIHTFTNTQTHKHTHTNTHKHTQTHKHTFASLANATDRMPAPAPTSMTSICFRSNSLAEQSRKHNQT